MSKLELKDINNAYIFHCSYLSEILVSRNWNITNAADANWDKRTLPKFCDKICGRCRWSNSRRIVRRRAAKLFATDTRRLRPRSAFSGAISRRQKNWIASPLVWVACFRLAGEASSLRRRVRWRRQLAMKSTSTSRNRKESPREYAFFFDLLVENKSVSHINRRKYMLDM